MTPVVFINCKDHPFVFDIEWRVKKYETRNKNTLGRFVGQRVIIAETGRGKPVARCSAVIQNHIIVLSKNAWEKYYRSLACIPQGSKYDWQPETKEKHCYGLTHVQKIEAFIPEGKRHGRVWMEYEEE